MSKQRSRVQCSVCVAWLACAWCGGGEHASGNSPADANRGVPPSNAAAAGSDVVPAATAETQAAPGPGNLIGILSRVAWLSGGAGTTFSTQSPCGDEDCSNNTSGVLCARGHIVALACPDPNSCDWDTNWGAMIGINLSAIPGQPWGSSAATGIAVYFNGGPGEYRLTAHVAGEPTSKVYCVENYPSGQFIESDAFLTACWDSAGEVLSSFTAVDQLGLQIISAQDPIDFDFCISDMGMF